MNFVKPGGAAYQPSTSGASRQQHQTTVPQQAQAYALGRLSGPPPLLPQKRKTQVDESEAYYNDEDEEDEAQTTTKTTTTTTTATSDDDDFDPLDAFMAGVNETIKEEAKTIGQERDLPEIVSGVDEHDYDAYAAGSVGGASDDDDDKDRGEESDDGGKVKTRVEPLPQIDHSKQAYAPFRKSFYTASAEVSSWDEATVASICDNLEVDLQGDGLFSPILSFDQAGFPSALMKEIKKAGYQTPTPIQSASLPITLSGRDLIGLAKTGSGKTMSYLWPMIIHVMDQPQMEAGDGCIALILSPTRELASQIYAEAKKFTKAFNIRVCAIFGGISKWEMTKSLKAETPEIIIATPGRMIDLIRTKATNLLRCTMLVLDEADKMFEMGFEYQVRSIVNNVRPDRQTLLFSATMKRKVEGFAREVLSNPIRIAVGQIGMANPDISQQVHVVAHDAAKLEWLSHRCDEFVAEGKVLVFVASKAGVESVAATLRQVFAARHLDVGVECLHGDKSQSERTSALKRFSKAEGDSGVAILVATDVASRGLDVKDIRTVINLDAPKNIDTYVHRIGRTGRMGQDGIVPGTAFSLLTQKDTAFAGHLVQNLRLSSQPVPVELLRLAETDARWKVGGGGGGGGKKWAGGKGGGLGLDSSAKALTSEMLANKGSSSYPTLYSSAPLSSSAPSFAKALGISSSGSSSRSSISSSSSSSGDGGGGNTGSGAEGAAPPPPLKKKSTWDVA